ncbi:MAG: hypothetical protein LBB54_04885 [Cellulomonadaceae bacterium]|jgi:antitoxin ParD1/3/4|nr:hypothetical protein [Cellulomonadaceae bacterium]
MTVTPISFRPNETDQRILASCGQSPTDALRQGLRLLDHERWLEQFRADALTQHGFNPNDEAEAW